MSRTRKILVTPQKQTFVDALGRVITVKITGYVNRTKKYPSHGAKRGPKPLKDDAV